MDAFAGNARVATSPFLKTVPGPLSLKAVPGTAEGAVYVESALRHVSATGGRIRFNLRELDLKAALDPSSAQYGSITSQELRFILGNEEALARTTFYLKGTTPIVGRKMLQHLR